MHAFVCHQTMFRFCECVWFGVQHYQGPPCALRCVRSCVLACVHLFDGHGASHVTYCTSHPTLPRHPRSRWPRKLRDRYAHVFARVCAAVAVAVAAARKSVHPLFTPHHMQHHHPRADDATQRRDVWWIYTLYG